MGEAGVKSWPLSVDRSSSIRLAYDPESMGTREHARVDDGHGDENRRRDPEDGVWRSYREIVQIYGTQYSQRDIDDYWEFMQQDDTQAQSIGFPSGKSVQEKPPQKLDANAQMRQKMQQKHDTCTMHREEDTGARIKGEEGAKTAAEEGTRTRAKE